MVRVTTELPLLDIIAVIIAIASLIITIFIALGVIGIHGHVETIQNSTLSKGDLKSTSAPPKY